MSEACSLMEIEFTQQELDALEEITAGERDANPALVSAHEKVRAANIQKRMIEDAVRFQATSGIGLVSVVSEKWASALEQLIVHMQIHSGYAKNGYSLIASRQQAFYDAIGSRGARILEGDPEWMNEANPGTYKKK